MDVRACICIEQGQDGERKLNAVHSFQIHIIVWMPSRMCFGRIMLITRMEEGGIGFGKRKQVMVAKTMISACAAPQAGRLLRKTCMAAVTLFPPATHLGVPRIRRRAFYVGGIDPECCAEDLQDFCKDVCPLMGCRVMPSRRTGTRCAYIEVDETKVETFRSIIWPENLYARDWGFSERDGQQTKNKNDK